MHWQYNPYVLPLVITAAISATIAFFAWRRRPAPGAMPLVFLMLAVCEWSLGYAVGMASADLPAKVFWAKVQYFGIVSVPIMWLFLVLQYTNLERWLTRRNRILLAMMPLLTLLLAWTNESHGLVWSGIRLDTSGSFSVLYLSYGAFFWVWVSYSYLLVLLGSILLLQAAVRSPHLYRRQAVALLIATLAPWVGNVLRVSGLNPFPHLDLTNFAFTLSGLVAAWALFRLRLLDIVPVAYDAVIKSMDDGVIVLDAQNRIVDINPAAGHIFGHSTSEAIGQPAARILYGPPGLLERYRDATEAQAEIILGIGEARRTFDLHISPLYDQHERLTGRLIVLRDFTERKRAEEALQKAHNNLDFRVRERTADLMVANEQLQREITERKRMEEALQRSKREWENTFHAISDWVSLLDLERRIMRTNAMGEEWGGMTLTEMVGQICCKLVHGAEKPIPGCPLQKMLHTRRRETVEIQVPGEDRWLMITVDPVMDEDGNLVSAVHIARDITERKRATATLQEYSERLEEIVDERTKELREAQEQLIRQEKLAILGQLSGGVAHELRNPLAMISTAVYFLRLTHPDADEITREYLEMIAAEVRKSDRIISDLLDFSRTRPPARERAAVSELVAAVLKKRTPPEDVEVTTQIVSDLPPVYVDPYQVEQVLANLITNAYQAMPEGGFLTISARVEKGQVALSVADTGVGIPEENMAKLFEPLFTTKTKGLGLGLMVVKTLVEANGGNVEVQSQVGRGSTFTVRLPVVE